MTVVNLGDPHKENISPRFLRSCPLTGPSTGPVKLQPVQRPSQWSCPPVQVTASLSGPSATAKTAVPELGVVLTD